MQERKYRFESLIDPQALDKDQRKLVNSNTENRACDPCDCNCDSPGDCNCRCN